MRCFPYSTILPVYCHRSEDAAYIVQEFHERYETTDFLQLPNYRTYVKLMVGGTPSKPFSAIVLARGHYGF